MGVAVLTVEPVEGALRLRLDRPDRDALSPVQREFRQPLAPGTLAALVESARALVRGGPRPGFAADAAACGATLYRTLVPSPLRTELRALRDPLVVASALDDVPWELLHDEEEFWGLRYGIGRRLFLEREVAVRRPPGRRDRLRALVVGADPRGDLPFVAGELAAVADALEPHADVVCVTDRLASLDRVLGHLGEGFDVIHFCGHVDADGGEPGLLLADGRRLTASAVEANLVGRPLVFVNGCASATGTGDAASIAAAFLHGGALAVVGTTTDVADEHAALLATCFHREALAGVPLGQALRVARDHVRAVAPASPAWLAFVLYGNPAGVVGREEPAKVVPIRAGAEVPEARPAALPVPARHRVWPWVAVALAVAASWLALRLGGLELRPAGGPVAVGVVDVRARGAGVPDWMRALTRDSLNTVLARVPQVQVYSRQKIDFLREKRGLTEIEAAEALGMRKLLAASVAVDGPQVTLEVEVVDIRSGVLEDTARVQGPETRLLELETELALRVLTALGVRPSDDELRAIVAERRDATVEAYRLLTETLGGRRSDGTTPPSPPTTVPPPGPGASWSGFAGTAWAQAASEDDAAIRELLRRYAAALESKRPEALAALQVAMEEDQRASLARYFEITTDLRVTVENVDVLVEGDDAVVSFTREDRFTDAPSGRAMHLSVRVSGRLVRRAGEWKIDRLGDPS
jgi:hypothetical protein